MADVARSIRLVESLEEYRACVRLQEETWGEGFSERVPTSMLKVSQRLGGVVAGAFDEEGGLEGFVFGITGLEDGVPVHWSDMLAVRPGRRDGGLGRALKEFQREVCLGRGVRRMYWTFDPLESRNAWLNMGRLGAVSREYVRDMYGPSDSPVHRGIGTDRFVATWLLDSPRVEARLAGRARPPTLEDLGHLPKAFGVSVVHGVPRPGRPAGELGGEAFLVPIPADVQAVKAADPEAASAWRRDTRHALEGGLGRGLEVQELVRGDEAVSWYLLAPRDDTDDREVAT